MKQIASLNMEPVLQVPAVVATPNNRKRTQISRGSNGNACVAAFRCLFQTWMCVWRSLTEFLRQVITVSTVFLAVTSAKYPVRCILLGLATSGGLLAVGMKTNFRLEFDLVRMFTPSNSRVRADRQWLEEDAWTKFPPYTETHFSVKVILHANGENVLTVEGVQHLFDALKVLQTTGGYDEMCVNESNFTQLPPDLQELAALSNSGCEIFSATRLWKHNETLFEQQVQNARDVSEAFGRTNYSDTDDAVIDLHEILGKIEMHDSLPVTAQAMYIDLVIPLQRIGIASRLFDFEALLQENIAVLRRQWTKSGDHLRVEFASGMNISDEFKQAILMDMPLVAFVFAVMVVFTCAVFWKCHRVQSRTALGLGAVLTIVMSLTASFGLMFCIGIPYTVATNLVPYVVFGVGLDDTFIVCGAFTRTSPKLSNVERIRYAFQECGLSIAMTSATTAIAFGLGCSSRVPAISMLCYYAFPAIIIDYIYQVTFFVAILVLDERRVQANRVDCCCWCACIHGQQHDTDDGNDEAAADSESPRMYASGIHDERSTASSIHTQETTWYQQAGYKVMEWYSHQLLKPRVKCSILLAFGSLFGFCLWRATMLEQNFSFFDLLPDTSYSKTYFEALKGYGGVVTNPSVLFRNINQSDPLVQEQMIDFLDALETIDGVVEEPFCWIRDVKGMMDDPSGYIQKLKQNPATEMIFQRYPQAQTYLNYTSYVKDMTFNEIVNAIMSNDVLRVLYGSNIVLDDQGDVVISRCTVEITRIDDESVPAQIQLYAKIKAVTNNQPINKGTGTTPYFFTYEDMYHLWEFFAQAIRELIGTSISGVVVVSLFAFVFMPHWTSILYIFPMMCVLYVDLLGLFQLFGLSINVLTYVIIVVAIGLLVDYVMHVLLCYYESHGKTREDKIKDMMTTMGTSILLGGTSTFLSTVPLVFSKSLIFKTCCTAFFIMVMLGLCHGLILVPVLLSMFGTTAQMQHPHLLTRPSADNDIIPDDHHDLDLNVSGTMDKSPRRRSSSSGSDTDRSSSASSTADQEEHNKDSSAGPKTVSILENLSIVTAQSSFSRVLSDKFGLKNLFILADTSSFGGDVSFEAVTPAHTVRASKENEFVEITI